VISELRVVDKDKTCIKWWTKVEAFKRRTVFKFKPGLNILWAPNGHGKTTLLLAIARMLHAEQGRNTTITQQSLTELFGFGMRSFRRGSDKMTHEELAEEEFKSGLLPVHDGQSVMYFDPGHAVGLSRGGAAFDEDFFMEGVGSLASRGSAGETTLQRMNGIFAVFLGKAPWPDIKYTMERRGVNDLWGTRIDVVAEFLKGTIPKGQPTILLDEPDRSLDIPYQFGIWRALPRDSKNFQIIVATHSLFALNIPGAHYIDMKKGYLKQCRDVMKASRKKEG